MFTGLQRVYQALEDAGVRDAVQDTLHLIDIYTGGAVRRAEMRAPLPDELTAIAAGRREGVPLEYLLGRASFMGLELECDRSALIPRAETELLVSVALDVLRARTPAGADRTRTRKGLEPVVSSAIESPLRDGNSPVELVEGDGLVVADVGTGSGNIAVALAWYAPEVRVVATDVSAEAVELARRQVARFGLERRIAVYHGDLFDPLDEAGLRGALDLVVCNPPYLPTAALAKLEDEIREHEPAVALDAGPYGMDVYRRLIKGAGDMLKENGVLVFEIGAGQERLVDRLFRSAEGYGTVRRHCDEEGRTRVISASKVHKTGHAPQSAVREADDACDVRPVR